MRLRRFVQSTEALCVSPKSGCWEERHMRQPRHVTFRGGLACAALVLSLGAGLASCGARVPPGGDSLRPASAESPASSPTSGVRSAPTASTPPGVVPSGGVVLTLDRSQYTSTTAIRVTINNGLSTAIYAETNHSDCELVTLERLVNAAWQVASSCSGALPAPRMEQIAPSGRVEQVLAAQKPGPTGVSVGASWPAGTYRIALVYVSSPGQPLNQGTTIYSPSFAVG